MTLYPCGNVYSPKCVEGVFSEGRAGLGLVASCSRRKATTRLCRSGSERTLRMSAEENKEKVRRFMEESFGGGKPELVDDLLDPDFVRYDPYIEAGVIRGAQTVKENIVWFRNAFPDLTCTIEEQLAEDDKVVSRWTVRGTHRGISSVLLARAIGWSLRASR